MRAASHCAALMALGSSRHELGCQSLISAMFPATVSALRELTIGFLGTDPCLDESAGVAAILSEISRAA
jgi:hypothetical protein